ncbi:hypothetical protein [Paenibacillus hubeiensis]|uniref:hypothetical protein n=1 Tax=Paenibacillus hubeiensis TaxID=3077330 RepID=UPI0031BAA4C8
MDSRMLFGVGLVLDTPEYGTIVVGANPDFDEMTPSAIKELIGDRIVIKTADKEDQVAEVVSLQINHSIAGKKNIGICLGNAISPDDIPAGAVIYSSQ